jgi:hypothetical protein
MKWTGMYLLGFVILLGGLLAALWKLGILATIGTTWTLIGVVIAIGLGIMISVSSSGARKASKSIVSETQLACRPEPNPRTRRVGVAPPLASYLEIPLSPEPTRGELPSISRPPPSAHAELTTGKVECVLLTDGQANGSGRLRLHRSRWVARSRGAQADLVERPGRRATR